MSLQRLSSMKRSWRANWRLRSIWWAPYMTSISSRNTKSSDRARSGVPSNAFASALGTRGDSLIQGDYQTGRVPGGSILAIVLGFVAVSARAPLLHPLRQYPGNGYLTQARFRGPIPDSQHKASSMSDSPGKATAENTRLQLLIAEFPEIHICSGFRKVSCGEVNSLVPLIFSKTALGLLPVRHSLRRLRHLRLPFLRGLV